MCFQAHDPQSFQGPKELVKSPISTRAIFSDLEILKALVQTLDGNEELIKDTLSQTAISLKQTADSIDKTADVYADKTKEGLTNKFEGTDKEKWAATASLAVEGGRSTVGIAVDRLNTASKVIEGIDIDSNVYKTNLSFNKFYSVRY